MSEPHSLKHFDVPLSTLQAELHPKRPVVGVAVIHRRKLLILQRAATEDILPNMYELPGGKPEQASDTTILDTVHRELLEETGLRVKTILREFDGFEYQTRKGISKQYNFIVEIEDGDATQIILNAEEHRTFAWINDTVDLASFPMSSSMEKVVRDALALI